MRPIDADKMIEKINTLKLKNGPKALINLDTLLYFIEQMPTLSIQEIEKELTRIKFSILQ